MAPTTATKTVRIDLGGLVQLCDALKRRGYTLVGPAIRGGAITYAAIDSIGELPSGWTSEQIPGSFHLKRRSDSAFFGYATGIKSLKDFLHPSDVRLFTAQKSDGAFRILPNEERPARQAFLGVRACELAAMGVQDRIFIQDIHTDPVYRSRRQNVFIVAVHCTEPAETCFCTSMGGNPRASSGFDLALTEFAGADNHEFLVEVGSESGADVIAEIDHGEVPPELMERSHRATARAAETMPRKFNNNGVHELLKKNFEHPEWERVAARCFACGNCTMVCPTCFCTTTEDSSDLLGTVSERRRKWDSCFSLNYSFIHGGCIRLSTKSRYRQWLTHKLSYWIDQFGSSGCVGCGRCITWCPAGIDLCAEVEAIRAAN